MRTLTLILTALFGFALQAHSARLSLEFGAGYSRSSAPALVTRNDSLALDRKTVGEVFTGYHGSLTLGIPLSRWLALQARVAGAFESGEVHHPPTLWGNGDPSIIPAMVGEANRDTYSFLGGLRVQDGERAWRVSPWAYALAGYAFQRMELKGGSPITEAVFYSDGKVIQGGFAMSLGLGTDVKIVKKLGVRVGVEYQPIFLGEEKVLSEGEVITSEGAPVTSRQDVFLVGETMHHWRVMVGPILAI